MSETQLRMTELSVFTLKIVIINLGSEWDWEQIGITISTSNSSNFESCEWEKSHWEKC